MKTIFRSFSGGKGSWQKKSITLTTIRAHQENRIKCRAPGHCAGTGTFKKTMTEGMNRRGRRKRPTGRKRLMMSKKVLKSEQLRAWITWLDPRCLSAIMWSSGRLIILRCRNLSAKNATILMSISKAKTTTRTPNGNKSAQRILRRLLPAWLTCQVRLPPRLITR